jgi:hypothetical protein
MKITYFCFCRNDKIIDSLILQILCYFCLFEQDVNTIFAGYDINLEALIQPPLKEFPPRYLWVCQTNLRYGGVDIPDNIYIGELK